MFNRSRVNSSSAPKGSSSSRISAPVFKSRASATRCCMPPESWLGKEKTKSFNPTMLSSSIASSSSAFVGLRTISVGRRTFSSEVRQSSSVAFWNISPTSRRGPFTGSPCTVSVPAVRSISPATMRNSVDLPHPDGPTSETKSPFGMSKLAPSSATTAPLAKVFPTPRPEITIPAPSPPLDIWVSTSLAIMFIVASDLSRYLRSSF